MTIIYDGFRSGWDASELLAAIVESSEDAILTKDLSGRITSFNAGAEKLFGYKPCEAIGESIMLLVPEDRREEEESLLSRIRADERISGLETVRRRKDGSLVDVSLTASPLRNREGDIVGMSSITRDITERKRELEEQRLLIKEMRHRVRNTFSLAAGLVSLSAREAEDAASLAIKAGERIRSLARAQELAFRGRLEDTGDIRQSSPTLRELIETTVLAYDAAGQEGGRIHVDGGLQPILGSAITPLSLLFHEFATNAVKYGALSSERGEVRIACGDDGACLYIDWTERNGPEIAVKPDNAGFGSTLTATLVENQLGGSLTKDWRPDGLHLRLSIPRSAVVAEGFNVHEGEKEVA